MHVSVYLPLLLPALVSLVATLAADRVRPGVAAPALAVSAVAAAGGTVWALALMVLTLFDDVPPWTALTGPEPIPDLVALLALAALAVAAVGVVRGLRLRHRTARRLASAAPVGEDVVVADWAEPLAVAVPGGGSGRVLVTTGLLRLLGPRERRAVFAHERAHLRHRHHLLVAATAAAASVNPLLRPARDTVAYLAERWADEDAASAVGDREVVARAVGIAALSATAWANAENLAGGAVVRRVRALRTPPRAAGRTPLLAAALPSVAACWLPAGHATAELITIFQAWTL